MEKTKNTKKSILIAAKKEFVQKGFREASLRNIVKNAGVTTGAFYGYYKSKEELFNALVNEAAEGLFDWYFKLHKQYMSKGIKEQKEEMQTIFIYGKCKYKNKFSRAFKKASNVIFWSARLSGFNYNNNGRQCIYGNSIFAFYT